MNILRDLLAREGITETPLHGPWGARHWTVECVSALTRREQLAALPDTARVAKTEAAAAFSIDLDEVDTVRVRIHAYRRPEHTPAPAFETWLAEQAERIPSGYTPTRIVAEAGAVRPVAS